MRCLSELVSMPLRRFNRSNEKGHELRARPYTHQEQKKEVERANDSTPHSASTAPITPPPVTLPACPAPLLTYVLTLTHAKAQALFVRPARGSVNVSSFLPVQYASPQSHKLPRLSSVHEPTAASSPMRTKQHQLVPSQSRVKAKYSF